MKKVAVLASGEGINTERIARLFNEGNQIRIDVVVTDRENAGVSARMDPVGVETIFYPREIWSDRPAEIVEFLQEHDIDLVVLDGFSQVLPSEFYDIFGRRIVDVQPALDTEFLHQAAPGDKTGVQKAIIDAGEKNAGVTAFYKAPDSDGGEIILQKFCPIAEGETPESLAEKVDTLEADVYPRAVVTALRETAQAAPASEPSHAAAPDVAVEAPEVKEIPVEKQWADRLGLNIDEERLSQTPPPVPGHNDGNSMPPRIPVSGTPAPGGVTDPKVQPQQPTDNVMPPTNLVWSVLATVFCCFIPGIIAIVFSSQVSTRFFAGDIEGAKRASRNAEIWVIVSFVLGVLSATLYLPMMIVGS